MGNASSKRGLVSVLGLAVGWLLLALWLVPWLRDFMAAGFVTGSSPEIGDAWPPPPLEFFGLVLTVVTLSGGSLLFIAWCVRRGGLGRVCDTYIDSDGKFVMAVVLWTAVVSAAVLACGEPTINDSKTHVARAWIWEEALRSGKIPVWTDLWYGGFLVDQYYPPLSHVLTALAGLIGLSPAAAAKLVVWLAGIAGATGFGIWCRASYSSVRAGLLGAVIYSLLPTIDAAWMWQGRLPGPVLMGVLPWAFFSVYWISNRHGSRRAAAGLALSLGAIVLAHTLQARIALVMLLLYAVAQSVRRPGSKPVWHIAGWCGGIAVSACFLLPVYLERVFVTDLGPQFTVLATWRTVSGFAARAFDWSLRGDAYPGITVIALALAGFWTLFRRARTPDGKRNIVSAIILVFSPWLLASGQPTDAVLLYVGFAFVAAGGIARWRGVKASHLFLVAVLALVIDIGPANLISTYVTHRDQKNTVYEAIRVEQGAGTYLELPLGIGGVPRSSYWHFVHSSPVASVAGPFIQGAPRSFVFRAALIDTVAAVLAAKSAAGEDLVEFLALENVSMVAVSNPLEISAPLAPLSPGIDLDPGLPVWRIVNASPVSILDSLPEFPLADLPAVTTIGIGTDTRSDRPESRRITAMVFLWMEAANPVSVAGISLVRGINRVDLRVPDVGGKTARIALAAYPTTTVQLDGAPADWRVGPMGSIVVELPPGAHRISIEVGITPTRRALGVILLLLVAGFSVLAVVPATRQQKQGG